MSAAELAEQLELMTYGVGAQTPDGTFPLPDKMPTFAPAALLRQAAARLRAMEEALKPFAEAQLLSQSAVIVAGDGITQAFDSGKKHVTCLMEEDGGTAFNRARAALSGEGQ